MKKGIAIPLAVFMALQFAGCMCAPSQAALLAYAALSAEAPEVTPEPAPVQPEETLPMPDGGTKPQSSEGSGTYHAEVDFSELKYERPDTQKLKDDMAALLKKVTMASSGGEMLMEEYKDIMDQWGHLDTAESLAYIYYSQDVTQEYYQDEYQYLEGEVSECDLTMTQLTLALAESPVTKNLMEEQYGADFISEAYRNEKLNAPEIQENLSKDADLVGQYDTALSTMSITKDGKQYTLDDLLMVEDYDLYKELLEQYLTEINQKAGSIFLQLVKLRTEIARELGYDSYADYGYDLYGRDYTTEDIKAVRKVAKEKLSTLYQSSYYKFYLMSDLSQLIENDTITKSTFFNQFQSSMKELSPLAESSINYMLRNNMYDLEVNPNKMETSYTTNLSDYGAPFIFSQWEDSSSSAKTVIHESGHYLRFYYTGKQIWNCGESLDLDEVDSQGLEMIMTDHYDTFFGGHAEAYEVNQLIDAMYAVLSGLMEDEFQEIVYDNPDMTLQEMNDTYLKLGEEYGMLTPYGEYWCMIPHTFQAPMYYVSYAVSMIGALQLWQLDEESPAEAEETYMKILQRSSFDELRTVLQDAGLSDPISANTLSSICTSLEKELNESLND